MRATIQQKAATNKKWIIPLVILIGSILIESFFGNDLFYHSYDSIIGVQDFLYEKMHFEIFNNKYNPNNENEDDGKNDTNVNSTLYQFFLDENEEEQKIILKKDTKDIGNFVKEVDGKIIFSEVVHFFNTNTFFIMICAIAYNFLNIYKIFVLTYTIFLSNFISSTLCFIFHSPRPYMSYYSIKPIIMFNEWGSPNTQIVVLISFSLAFYEAVISNRRMEESTIGKILIFILISLIVLFDMFLLFASGNISYNQIIFSLCLGIVVYQIIFLLFKVEVNNSKQFFTFLKFKTRYYLFINLILLAFEFILNIFIIADIDEDYYSGNIDTQQERLFYSKFLNDNFNYRRFFYLNKGNFCDALCFIMNIVAFLSLKLELYWKYKGDYENWSSNNFERPPQQNALLGDMTEVDDYFIRDATQWNHTGCCKTVVRLFFIIILCLCSLLPSVLIYYFINSTEANGYLFIIIVPQFLLVFGMFYLFKAIMRCFKLTKKR